MIGDFNTDAALLILLGLGTVLYFFLGGYTKHIAFVGMMLGGVIIQEGCTSIEMREYEKRIERLELKSDKQVLSPETRERISKLQREGLIK